MIKISGFGSAHVKLTVRCGMIQYDLFTCWKFGLAWSPTSAASSSLWRIDTIIFGKWNNLIKAFPSRLNHPSLFSPLLQTWVKYIATPPEFNRGFTAILKNHIQKNVVGTKEEGNEKFLMMRSVYFGREKTNPRILKGTKGSKLGNQQPTWTHGTLVHGERRLSRSPQIHP